MPGARSFQIRPSPVRSNSLISYMEIQAERRVFKVCPTLGPKPQIPASLYNIERETLDSGTVKADFSTCLIEYRHLLQWNADLL